MVTYYPAAGPKTDQKFCSYGLPETISFYNPSWIADFKP